MIFHSHQNESCLSSALTIRPITHSDQPKVHHSMNQTLMQSRANYQDQSLNRLSSHTDVHSWESDKSPSSWYLLYLVIKIQKGPYLLRCANKNSITEMYKT